MVREFEFYHGAALTRLIHGHKNISIEQYSAATSNASYVINEQVGLYLKHSTSRLSPWVFTFKKEHQDEVRKMKDGFGEVFIILICGKDGMVCLSYKELRLALDDDHGPAEWLKAARRTREKYAISGTDGKLKTKIGENEFPSKIISCLEDQESDGATLAT
ncbi:MAG TPA: hypothetical protein VK674_07390 [Candidatus Limnocylindria bacterium]|nr:hypothetical protein [Candidatus Limnocylindria bacterium]